MSESEINSCGLYRTNREIAGVPVGRLVYFHNHGDPGPGIYLPSGWKGNRAQWQPRGHTLESIDDAAALTPVKAEGFYRVSARFHCCDKKCRLFEPETLVQLGYNGAAEPILFLPQLNDSILGFPERGVRVDRDRVENLSPLKVAVARTGSEIGPEPGVMLH